MQNVASGWGLSLPLSGISLNNAASCGGMQRLVQVTLTKTFTSVAPLLVHLNAGGITLTAAACYPNNS